MVQSKPVLRFAISACALMVLTSSATAELLVSGTAGVGGLAVGAKYSDDYVFRLPANAELRLLRSPDNTPFVMRGPYEGTLSGYIASCNGFLAPIRSYCRDSAGDRPPVGATRGIRHPD
jgi:hypothetical protein